MLPPVRVLPAPPTHMSPTTFVTTVPTRQILAERWPRRVPSRVPTVQSARQRSTGCALSVRRGSTRLPLRGARIARPASSIPLSNNRCASTASRDGIAVPVQRRARCAEREQKRWALALLVLTAKREKPQTPSAQPVFPAAGVLSIPVQALQAALIVRRENTLQSTKLAQVSECANNEIQSSQLHPNPSRAACKDCTAGKYSGVGDSFCTPCPLGRYNGGEQASGCSNCPAGKISEFFMGSMQCVNCAAGKSSVEGSYLCIACSSGKYSASAGSQGCSECGVGKSASGVGSVFCPPCVPGKITDETGESSCDGCSAGRTSNDGGTGCTDCPGGKYSESSGSASCTTCPSGKTSEANSLNGVFTNCEVCPLGKTSTAGSGCGNCPNSSGWLNGACYPLSTNFNNCPDSSMESKYNLCSYYHSGTWTQVSSALTATNFSPFGTTCGSYSACHRDTSDSDYDEYHVFCASCADGFEKFTFPTNQGDCSFGSLSSSTPGICYKPSNLNACPGIEGITCNYVFNGGVVSKSAGESSPFSTAGGNSCAEFKVCSVSGSVWT